VYYLAYTTILMALGVAKVKNVTNMSTGSVRNCIFASTKMTPMPVSGTIKRRENVSIMSVR
jgi:hypothetical protein